MVHKHNKNLEKIKLFDLRNQRSCLIQSNSRDENTNVPSVFRLRHENSQMPCNALLCVGPAKLGDAVHSSLPLRFSGEHPHSLWMFHL